MWDSNTSERTVTERQEQIQGPLTFRLSPINGEASTESKFVSQYVLLFSWRERDTHPSRYTYHLQTEILIYLTEKLVYWAQTYIWYANPA